MLNTLKGWLVDNTITTENKDDKILVLESAGNVDVNKVYDEMLSQDTGLRRETLVHVVSCGVTLTGSKGAVVRLDDDLIAVNKPSELTLLMPSDLADDTYTLTITTQYTNRGGMLKVPRSVSTTVFVGSIPGGGGDENPDDL